MKELKDISLEGTHILLNSLDLQKAVTDFFRYLRTFLPIKLIMFGSIDSKVKSVFLIAYADENNTVPLLYYHEYGDEKKQLAEEVNFFTNKEDFLVLSKEDPLYNFYISPDIPFSLPLISHRFHETLLYSGAATFCFEEGTVITQEYLEQLESLKLPIHIFINTHFRIWELEQLNQNIAQDNLRLRKKAMGLEDVEIIGSNGGLRETMEKLQQVSPLNIPILLHGATGTGKEVIAHAAHALSPRKNFPFVAVNCGAIPSSLIDSELFGYNKGAFTGATNAHKGHFERADQGTLFLDEIAELPLEAQVRLLRVLQEHTIQRIGSPEVIYTDFRLITATHKNLRQMIELGTFREDLFYRLSVITIDIPVLKERKEDIPLLLEHFIKIHSSRFGMLPPRVPYNELAKLMQYDWDGNVRELENVVVQTLALSPKGEFCVDLNKESTLNMKPHSPITETHFSSFDNMVKNYLIKALEISHGKIQGNNSASELLQMNESTLRTKLRKYNIPFGKNEQTVL